LYQDQGRIAEQLEQRKQDSTDVVEVQEAISDALVRSYSWCTCSL